ncbi:MULTISPECIES: HAMP domain-containing sensor histidine kinase [unclassified Streptomyces]|uniref:sensor histidine kinase n=1 Tax=unclassified Streptomyces TaxID=2593676 RepID=UPI001370111E|nr:MULTISPECIES: HAMP domain-containing sensor histidine kinase [unclassified Streptomyces]MYY84092.1 HAMP domain-containing protein [Streptomyces sp. SID335]MYZ18390.1 HAMP domain-containing protein [Streptomyces sp. SID337]NDZ86853.1 HAMP domain-containing protein [Streptomyces sp. SID10115]NEB42857.1 HAMP domain-containing protein [Streptomyces sp. SID339]
MHLPSRRAGVRLTLLYGALLVASGAVLLALTYLLVLRFPADRVLVDGAEAGMGAGADASNGRSGGGFPGVRSAARSGDVFARLQEQASRQHADQLRELLVQSGVALAVMLVVSAVLGRLVARRVLRPLRTMTGTVQRISAHTLHERLALQGPADELKEFADTVDGLIGRLEGALHSRRRFVADAAHALRAPLTLEHTLLRETLTDRDATAETFRASSERLLEISRRQARILESLLALAGSHRGLVHREELDLAPLAEWALHIARPESERHGLRVSAAVAPAPVTGDPALVQRLVSCLVDNAVAHNRPGGRVEITTAVRDGHAVVSVANTGDPVAPEQVHRLFQPLRRVGRTADDGHPGLGLVIVHAIALAHDAVISARARADGGLAVEVAFPRRTVRDRDLRKGADDIGQLDKGTALH